MAILPLPQRGQPIDYDYMYQLTDAINKLSNQVQKATSGNIIDKDATGRGAVKVPGSETLIVAKKVSKTFKRQDANREITVDFGANFAYPPVVTTSVLIPTAQPGYGLARIISITQTSVTLRLQTDADGTKDAIVQIIAVGIKGS